MKLEKREITLNEIDSLSDMYYFERMLVQAYTIGRKNVETKQISSIFEERLLAIEEETKRLKKEISALQ